MKKLFLTLAMMALPLTANAQRPPKHVPDVFVQKAIEEFVEPWCETGYSGLISNVENCYIDTLKYNPEIDKCILGDNLLRYVTRQLQAYSKETGTPDRTANIAFVSPEVRSKRIQFTFQTPKYAEIGLDIVAYFAPGNKAIRKAFVNEVDRCSSH